MMPESNQQKKEEFEKKKISVISVSGGMIWAIGSTLLGAYLGTTGTLYGVAIGAGGGSAWAVWWENTATKALMRVKARKSQEEAEANAITPAGQERLGRNREQLIRERQQDYLRHRNPAKTAFFATCAAGACFIVTLGAVLTVEASTGRTLHSDLTGTKQYGTSFGYSTVPPSPAPQVTPAASFSLSPSADASPTLSPSVTVSASPDESPTGGASSVPASSSSSSTTPSPTPSGPTAPAANAVPSSSTATTVP